MITTHDTSITNTFTSRYIPTDANDTAIHARLNRIALVDLLIQLKRLPIHREV
jgi:hypothetical protein